MEAININIKPKINTSSLFYIGTQFDLTQSMILSEKLEAQPLSLIE